MNRLLKPFYYMFYRIAYVNKVNNLDTTSPHIYASGLLSLCLMFNITFLVGITQLVTLSESEYIKYIVIPVIIISYINDYFFFTSERLAICEERWKNENKNMRRLRGVLIICYVIVSFILCFVGLSYM